MIIPLVVIIASVLSLIFAFLAITEKDLLRAVGYSAGQSIMYAIILQVFAVPDILMTYVAVSVGIYSGLLIYVVSKTERWEK